MCTGCIEDVGAQRQGNNREDFSALGVRQYILQSHNDGQNGKSTCYQGRKNKCGPVGSKENIALKTSVLGRLGVLMISAK